MILDCSDPEQWKRQPVRLRDADELKLVGLASADRFTGEPLVESIRADITVTTRKNPRERISEERSVVLLSTECFAEYRELLTNVREGIFVGETRTKSVRISTYRYASPSIPDGSLFTNFDMLGQIDP